MNYTRLQEHIDKAVSKHTEFCTRLCHKNPKTIHQRLTMYRKLGDMHGSAEYILLEEIYEAFEAAVNGDVEQSIDEWYDAYAVIERIIQMLEAMKNEQ